MDRTIATYAAWAPTYDTALNPTRDADERVMRKLSPRFAGCDLLELGCGTGKNTVTFASRARAILGLDLCAEMLAIAQARPLPSSVRLVTVTRGEPWPTPDASMDVVTASLVLEHIADLSGVFSEAARVLRPGGWCWMSELHPARMSGGSKARYVDAAGHTHSPDCFLHSFSDYVTAAHAARLQLREVQEPGEGAVPRLLVIGFQLMP